MERHKPDWISLTFGVVFVFLAVILPAQDSWNFSQWVLPVAVLLLGVGIAVAAIASTRTSR